MPGSHQMGNQVFSCKLHMSRCKRKNRCRLRPGVEKGEIHNMFAMNVSSAFGVYQVVLPNQKGENTVHTKVLRRRGRGILVVVSPRGTSTVFQKFWFQSPDTLFLCRQTAKHRKKSAVLKIPVFCTSLSVPVCSCLFLFLRQSLLFICGFPRSF